MTKKVVEAVELAHIQAKLKKERAIEAATDKYLAMNAFEVVKGGCFLEGFENFWELAAEVFPDCDFSFIIPNEGEKETEEGQEGADKGEEGEGSAKGAVEDTGVAALGEGTSGDANPQA